MIKPGFFDEDANFDDTPNTAYEEYEKCNMPKSSIKIISNNSLNPIILPNDNSIKIEFDKDGNIKKSRKE